MANTITKTVLHDGPRNLVVQVAIAGDGSGDETGTVLIDRSAYAPVDGTKLSVREIEGALLGFSAQLLFDATADLPIASLPDGQPFEFDWCDVGGVASPKAGAGYTGDILITTSGLGSGDKGTFLLSMKKS